MKIRAFTLTLAAMCLASVLPALAVTACKNADQEAPTAAVGQSVSETPTAAVGQSVTEAPTAAVGQSVSEAPQPPEETLPTGLPTYKVNANWRTRWIIYGDGISIKKETITDELQNMDYNDRHNAYREFNSNYTSYDYFYIDYDSVSEYGGAGEKVGMRGNYRTNSIRTDEGGVSYETITDSESRFDGNKYYWDDTVLFAGNAGESISYFDGERAITREKIGSRTEYIEIWGGSSSREIPLYKYRLSDTNMNDLAQDYDHLVPSDREAAAAAGFIGIRDDQIKLLDYDGNVVSFIEKPPEASTIFALTNGLYVYGYNSSETAESFWWEQPENYSEAVLGPGLEVLVPLGKYTQISVRRYFKDYKPMELLFCDKFIRPVLQDFGRYKDNVSMYRTDIYSVSGELMIEGLTRVFDVTRDRIAVTQGAYGGLMDWNGNWIVRIPVYTDLMDD